MGSLGKGKGKQCKQTEAQRVTKCQQEQDMLQRELKTFKIKTRQILFHQLFEYIKVIGVFDLIWQSIPVVNGSIIKGKSSLALGSWNNKIKWTTPAELN